MAELLPPEEWRPIERSAGVYEVSNLGRVRRAKPGKGTHVGKVLTPGWTGPQKYYAIIAMSISGSVIMETVHTLVLETFVCPRPPGCEVNHRNGIKADNRLDNLEWTTHRENMRHAFSTGLINRVAQQTRTPKGERNEKAKLTTELVRIIRHLGGSSAEIARILGVANTTVERARSGRSWKHVT